jgi:hypothetical protein
MNIWAVALGLGLGAALFIFLTRQRIFKPNIATALVLIAIAAFYPAFALHSEASLWLHSAVFIAFAGFAIALRARGILFLGIGIVAHGIFDAALFFSSHTIHTPGPVWWPEFCATVDIVLGVGLIYSCKRAPE